jgi:hypothetical protein
MEHNMLQKYYKILKQTQQCMNGTTPFSVNQHKFIYTLQTVKTKYIFSYAGIEASISFSH